MRAWSDRIQAHITTLPWEARALASGYGYVCVGGAEEGNFASIKVTGFPSTEPSDVDASLPLNFQHRLPRPPPLGAANRIRLEKIGDDIVNSISIHNFEGEHHGQDEVVAVLTNNDKTVRVYSLTQKLETTVLALPFPMNHATISPDGKMLVAVGDQPTGYFFERNQTQKPSSIKSTLSSVTSFPPDWQLLEQVALYRPTSGHCAEGYFSTAWSPCSRLCAVGSECGYITLLDVELLRHVEYAEDAIIHVVSSTRPDTGAGAGAVRTMYFSPAPWDFLIWSEDQGRVCVADLRDGLKARQVLNLDPKDESFEKVEIADFDITINPEMHELHREADFIRSYRRALDSEGTAAAVDAANVYFEADSERQRAHRRLGVVDSDNDPHGLTANEREILDSLQSTRRHEGTRENAREQGLGPRSINYNTARHVDISRRQMEIMAEFAPEGVTWRTSMSHTRTAPRRQASVVVSIDPATINIPPIHTNITDSAPTRSPNPIPAHARRVADEIVNSTDEAWRTIEEALSTQARRANSARATTSNPTSTTNTVPSATPELRNELRRLRQMTQMRERLRSVRATTPPTTDAYEFSLGLRRSSRLAHDPRQGVRTAGLAMSQDGRTLYCGTEEGIFEFKLNLQLRKSFPAVQPR